MDRYIILFILIIAAGACDGLYSRWLRNTDLANPYNWDAGRPPCGNDRVIIPDDSPVVFMQLNTTVQELVLPINGELVFGSYATLAFTNEPDHSATCLDSGTELEFNASHPAQWVDPLNWCPTTEERSDCLSLDLLDSERIPCATDDVIFPTGSSYYVDLGAGLNIEVNTLKVSGKAYSTGTFVTYLGSESGRDIFPAPTPGRQSSVTIHRRRCTDNTGCACGNDNGQMLASVCGVQGSRCVRARCRTAIRPVGHCCDVCGALLNVTVGVGYDFNVMKTALQRNFLDAKDAYSNVKYMVSKRSDGKVQIVLTDSDGIQSGKAGGEMLADIQADISMGGFRYGITTVSMQVSGAGPPSPSTSRQTGIKIVPRGEVAGIIVGVLIGLGILAFISVFIYRRHRNRLPDDLGFKVFNKFRMSTKPKPQVSVPPSVGFSWSVADRVRGAGPLSQGFDNPMYGSTPLENIKEMELEMRPTDFDGELSAEQPVDRGFDNPLYDSAHQESLFSDPTAVENPTLDTIMTIGPPVMTIGPTTHDTGDTDA